MIRELTDNELDAVSGGILNVLSFQANFNATGQSNISLVNILSPQTNVNGTLQINA